MLFAVVKNSNEQGCSNPSTRIVVARRRTSEVRSKIKTSRRIVFINNCKKSFHSGRYSSSIRIINKVDIVVNRSILCNGLLQVTVHSCRQQTHGKSRARNHDHFVHRAASLGYLRHRTDLERFRLLLVASAEGRLVSGGGRGGCGVWHQQCGTVCGAVWHQERLWQLRRAF